MCKFLNYVHLLVDFCNTFFFYVQVRGKTWNNQDEIVDDLLTPCSPSDPNAIKMTWVDVEADKLLEPIVSMVRIECKIRV